MRPQLRRNARPARRASTVSARARSPMGPPVRVGRARAEDALRPPAGTAALTRSDRAEQRASSPASVAPTPTAQPALLAAVASASKPRATRATAAPAQPPVRLA